MPLPTNPRLLTDLTDTDFATAEDDWIQSLGGADLIDGGLGDDLLEGGAGNDTLRGRAGMDTLLGGEGADRLEDGPGGAIMTGGTENDIYVVTDAASQVIEAADGGYDTMLRRLIMRYLPCARVTGCRTKVAAEYGERAAMVWLPLGLRQSFPESEQIQFIEADRFGGGRSAPPPALAAGVLPRCLRTEATQRTPRCAQRRAETR